MLHPDIAHQQRKDSTYVHMPSLYKLCVHYFAFNNHVSNTSALEIPITIYMMSVNILIWLFSVFFVLFI